MERDQETSDDYANHYGSIGATMDINKAVLKFVKLGITMILAMLILYGTISVSLIGFDFGYRVFTEPAMEEEPGRDVVVVIEKGMGDMEIGAILEKKGLVRNGTLFMIQLKLSAYADELHPGTYVMNTSMAPKELMMMMAEEPETEGTETDTNDK